MDHTPHSQANSTDPRILELVEQMRAAERELEKLTGGQLDAITTADGGPLLLRKAQEKLRQQEAAQRQSAEELTIETRRLHESQAVAKVGSWETDLKTLEVKWTEETFRIFETTPEEFDVTHEGFLERVHPEDRQMVEDALKDSLGQPGTFVIEHRLLFADGRIKFVEERWQTFNDPTGKPVRAVGTVQDITDRKQAERAMTRSEASLVRAQRIAHMGNWDWNIVTGELYWSVEVFRLFGMDPSEASGTYEQFLNRLHPDDREPTHQAVMDAVDGIAPYNVEHRVLWPDGTVRVMHEQGEVERDAAGRALNMVGTVMDITDRKRAEAERSRMFNLSMDLLSIGSFDGKLEEVNPAWTKCLGWSVEELTSKPWLDFVHPEDQAATIQIGEGITAGLEARDFENRYICKDGSYRWLSWNSHPLLESQQIFAVARDVTERRENEEQLRLLETCVSRLNDIVLITEAEPIDSPGPRIIYVNDAFTRLTGYTREEAIGKTPRMLQGPKTQRETLDRIREGLKARKRMREELINYTKSGDEYWIEIEIVPVADDQGSPTHFIAVQRDITERKRSEAALVESQRRYRDLVETSKNVIWEVDLDGRFTFLNQASRAVFGRDPEEMIGHRFHEFVPEDQHRANDEIMAAMLRNGEDTIDYVNRIRRKDGSIAILNSNARVVRDAQGQMTGISGMSQDTTEVARAQEAILRSEERFRGLFDQAAVGMCIASDEGVFLRTNERFCKIVGYSAEEMLQRDCIETTHPDDREMEADRVARMLKGESQTSVWEKRYLHKDGHPVWCNLTLSLLPDGNGRQQFVGVIEDITERRAAVEKLRHREQLLGIAGKIAKIGGWSVELPEVRIIWSDEICAIHDIPVGNVPGLDQALDFYTPESRPVIESAFALCVSEGTPFDLEVEIVTGKGRHIWVRVIGQAERDEAGTITRVQGASQDISQQKAAELEINRTNRALKMLSGCNESLIHAEDEMALLQDVCELAVQTGGYRMAWVGYAQDDEERSITPMTHAGVEDGYLDEVNICWNEQVRSGQGPAGRAIRSGEPAICEDMEIDESFLWLKEAKERGFRAVTCLPLRDKQHNFGLLALYSGEVKITNTEELKLLQDMADDLAFGILNLRSRIERSRTHEAVLTMARGISESAGDEFFERLTFSMVEALGADAGFIARLSDDKSKAISLCTVVDGKLVDDFEHTIAGTPCEHLGSRDVFVVPKDVQQSYPHAPMLKELDASAYVGTELLAADGKPCGMMSVLFRQPLAQHQFISSTLKIFASRAAGELERRKTENILREQAALLDKAQDAIIVRDLDHTVLYWNRSAERLYGWTAEEAIGRTIRELIYKDSDPLDAALKTLFDEDEWIGEIQQFTKDGKPLTVEGRWSLVRDEQGNPKSVLAINTDITERKKIESQYLRAQRMESIGTLAGGIAHDLNNVLAPIMMSIELLQIDETDENNLNILSIIEDSAKRGADMVQQVLSFARGVEGQKLELQPGYLLEQVRKVVKDTFPKNIVFKPDIAPDLWKIQGDATQLHQVLINICVNARDAMPDGGTLTLSASNIFFDEQYAGMNIEAKPGPYLNIQLGDSGIGIPADEMERVFEPFFTTKELGKGTGLGLSTTMGIIKSHGGFIRLYSEVGMGTRFNIYLPALTADSVEHDPVPAELQRGNNELILLVDDEKAVRDITSETLKTFGYRVIEASDGVEATSIYAERREEIALVLTDMMMPLMDGAKMIQVLLRINPKVRIIAASGLSANSFVSQATHPSVKNFISKPYTAETLLKTIREALDD